jgi:hypothetical protein
MSGAEKEQLQAIYDEVVGKGYLTRDLLWENTNTGEGASFPAQTLTLNSSSYSKVSIICGYVIGHIDDSDHYEVIGNMDSTFNVISTYSSNTGVRTCKVSGNNIIFSTGTYNGSQQSDKHCIPLRIYGYK